MEKGQIKIKMKRSPSPRLVRLGRKKSYKSGFSLVEVLITLMILSVGLTAVSALMAGNIKSSQNSKNQIIASQLAQEGVELIRNLKDNKQLDGAPNNYTSGSGAEGTTTNGLRIDKNLSLNNSDAGQLYLDNNGFYGHASSANPTKFYRTISLNVIGDKAASPSTRKITATSYMTWNGKGFIDELSNIDATNCKIANKCVSVVSVMPDLN